MTEITCLIGEGSPNFRGTAVFAVVVLSVGLYGVLSYTIFVNAFNSAAPGTGITLNAPVNKVAMYCICGVRFLVGFGPFTSGMEERPFPLATYSVLSSGLSASAVGYHPTGMNPSTKLCARRGPAKETTATQLLSALATNKRRPSRVSATALVVEPMGDLG